MEEERWEADSMWSRVDPAAPSSNTTYSSSPQPNSASVLILWRIIFTPFFSPEINTPPQIFLSTLCICFAPLRSSSFLLLLLRSSSSSLPLLSSTHRLTHSPPCLLSLFFFQPPPPPPTLPAEVGCLRCRDNCAVGASATRPVIILSENLLCGWCVWAILHSQQLYLWRYVGWLCTSTQSHAHMQLTHRLYRAAHTAKYKSSV